MKERENINDLIRRMVLEFEEKRERELAIPKAPKTEEEVKRKEAADLFFERLHEDMVKNRKNWPVVNANGNVYITTTTAVKKTSTNDFSVIIDDPQKLPQNEVDDEVHLPLDVKGRFTPKEPPSSDELHNATTILERMMKEARRR